jgi:CBS-domain-containing membrane protein
MNVDEIMTREVWTCGPDDSLEEAARLMWERDCGCVPVVDGSGHVQAMLTDRDVCMAAYTQGGPLRDLRVRGAMSDHVVSVSPGEPVAEAERMMQEHQVRRLPVLDEEGRLLGLLSLNDLANGPADNQANAAGPAARPAGKRSRQRPAVPADELALTLTSVCKRRVLSSEPGAGPMEGDDRWQFSGA